MVCKSLQALVLVISLTAAGCGKTEPATTAGRSVPDPAPPQPIAVAPPELIQRDDLDLRLPGEETEVPEWAGKRSDDPFPVKEFLESRSPANNIAPLYLQVLAPFEEALKLIYPVSEREERGLEAAERQRLISEYSGYKPRSEGPATSTEVQEFLNEVRPLLNQIALAQERGPCVFRTGMRMSSLAPHGTACVALGRLARLEIEFAQLPEEWETVFETIERTFRLSRDIRPRGLLILQLVSNHMDAIILQCMADLLVPRTDLTTAHCDRLLQLVREHKDQGIDSYQEAARMEYIMLRNSIEDLAAGRTTLEELDPGLSKNPNVPKLINYDIERAEAGRIFSIVFEESQLPWHKLIRASRFGAEADKLRNGIAAGPADVLLGGKLRRSLVVPMLIPAMDQAREADARYRVRMGAIPAIIAIRRYEIVHGSLPDSLNAALAEVGITEIPIDPYDSKPLKYVVINGRPTVYSVGGDLEDQGGLVRWDFTENPGDFLFTYTVQSPDQ